MSLEVIYTDGGCKHNGIGGWAYLVLDKNKPMTIARSDSGFEWNTTNNRMELKASIFAIKSCTFGSRIKIYTDSSYLQKGFHNPSYLRKWINNGWLTSRGKPVENQDLWRELIQLDLHFDIQFVLIKGHSKKQDDPHKKWNDHVDMMCTNEMHRVMIEEQFITTKGYNIPVQCPPWCNIECVSQNSLCFRCPSLIGRYQDDDDAPMHIDEYREDWLKEWVRYFNREIESPILLLGGEYA